MFKPAPLREHRVAAAVAILLTLALQSSGLRAELLFRSAPPGEGRQSWSPVRSYANPSDTAAARGATAPAEEVHVFLSGEITHRDVASAGVMAGLLQAGRHKLAGNTVWLASEGGDVDAALALARLLRRTGIYTVVGKADRCMSACVFAFMGGERRLVAGQLGIHRPFFPFTQDAPDRQVRFRHLQKTLKFFVEEMDFPDSFYEAVMLVPPESVQVLGAAELKRFYLDGISPSSEDLADAALARRLGLPMAAYLRHKALAPACALPIAGQDRCDLRTQEAVANGGAADDPANLRTGGSAMAGRSAPPAAGKAPGPPLRRGTVRGSPASS